MAQIVFGMAVPHSGMLGKPGETWLEDGQRDRANPALWFDKRTWTYPELEAARGAAFAPLLSLDERRARSERCTRAIAVMAEAYAKAKVDVAIIIGKDQKEIFLDLTPSLAIYTGEEILNGPPQRSVYAPDHAVTHHGHPALAQHLIAALQKDGFDLTDLIKWPANQWMKGAPIVPHAFGFVYRQIMKDNPPPTVPILVNTFYPPTQPSMTRSIAFGKALLAAIQAWDSDLRVAVIASGGLSHFVCDETLDKTLLAALGSYDFNTLAGVDDRYYQSGTSEVKLYAAVLVAMQAIGAKMTLVDYVPCYRTEAGTGEGMGFMHWSLP